MDLITNRTRGMGLPAIVLMGVLLAALSALLPGGRVLAQGGDQFQLPEGVTWDQVNAIAHKMYCDVCEGIPLDECESIACRQWREEIARQLGLGRTEDEIIDDFVQRYGADVAALPRDPLDRVLALAVPIVLLLVVGTLGALQMRQYRKRGQHAGQVVARRSAGRLQQRPVPADLDPALLDRLTRELESLDR